MNIRLLSKRNFQALSVRDLLEARETFHVQLAHLDNVVATAIGRKRFRPDDLDKNGNLKSHEGNGHGNGHGAGGSKKSQDEKRLDNTVSPRWAWPCLLVFVRDWLKPAEFARRYDQIVPEFLYMPDGRVVPTCVLRMVESDAPSPASDHVNFASALIGGGYVAVADVQGKEHIGSIGCMVTDGDNTYALTNRHVAGKGGREVYSVVNGARVRLGVSDEKQVGKLPFEEVYPGWSGRRAFANLDAGLVRVDDVTGWTTQVFGVGEIDEPLDLNIDTISLDLIGCKVRAFGAASGDMDGEIQALFYRYKSIGGFDYVADLMIGGRGGKSLPTLPGDSGTLWFFEGLADDGGERKPADGLGDGHLRAGRGGGDGASTHPKPVPRLHPIAMQWGGHVVMDNGNAGRQEFRYALATCLSTVCRELDVDVVRDWNLGHVQYWGEQGHYSIGLKACGLVSQKKLAKLMAVNASLVGFDDQTMGDPDAYKMKSAGYKFVPLADVADDVWRLTRMGKNGVNNDSNNHFADMDQEGPDGLDLLTICRDVEDNPDSVDPAKWLEFYQALNGNGEKTNAGALPFRVWQMYDEAVAALKGGDDDAVARWFCLMGTMAHYGGDACQPLHVSRLHHGYPPLKKGTWKYDVHSVYETKMLDAHAVEVIAGLNKRLKGEAVQDDGKRGGQMAAVAIVKLMQETIKRINPAKLVDAYNNAESTPDARLEALWDGFGEKTMDCMAEGAKTLAPIWERAWAEGGGTAIPDKEIKKLSPSALVTMYRSPSLAPSMSLELMVEKIFAGTVSA